jgi:hypothetical protein
MHQLELLGAVRGTVKRTTIADLTGPHPPTRVAATIRNERAAAAWLASRGGGNYIQRG